MLPLAAGRLPLILHTVSPVAACRSLVAAWLAAWPRHEEPSDHPPARSEARKPVTGPRTGGLSAAKLAEDAWRAPGRFGCSVVNRRSQNRRGAGIIEPHDLPPIIAGAAPFLS